MGDSHATKRSASGNALSSMFAKKALVTDTLLCIVVVVSALKVLWPLEGRVDIQLDDESVYLTSGYRLPSLGLPPGSEAPLYSVWFYGLSCLAKDPVALYYLSYRAAAIGIPVLLFLLLRRYGAAPFPSALAAYFVLLSWANLVVTPRVSHLAVLVMLAALLAAASFRSSPSRIATTSAGVLLASYARPELFIAFLLLAVYAAYKLFQSRRLLTRGTVCYVAGVVLFCGVLAWVFGSPLGDGRRTSFAFQQHFSLNWVERNGGSQDPWTEYPAIMKQVFGDSSVGLGQAILANPAPVFRHFLQNLIRLPKQFVGIFLYHAAILLPASRSVMEAALLLGAIIVALIVYGKRIITGLRGSLTELREFLIVVLLILVPLCLSIVLIYPRQHYLLQAGILLIAAAMLLVARSASHAPSWKVTLIIAAALVIAAPGTLRFAKADSNLNTRRQIEAIRSLKIRDDVNVLQLHDGLAVYLGDNYSPVERHRKHADEGFDAYINRRHINMVLWTEEWNHMDKYANDPQWLAFLADYSSRGFRRIPIPDANAIIYAQERLLSGGP